MPNKPEYIVLHTAAHGTPSRNYDTTRAQIDAWHMAPPRNWKGIGYHYVARLNGETEKGREEDEIGAQARGLNQKSIGICFSGHGDFHQWTAEQKRGGMELIRKLMDKYQIGAGNVIGHRELNNLIAQGKLDKKFKVHKTCPGTLINMDSIRAELAGLVVAPEDVDSEIAEWGELIFDSLRTLYRYTSETDSPDNLVASLNEFRNDPKIDRIIKAYKLENDIE
jgi:hypothetical protein